MKASALREWLSGQVDVLEAACGRESAVCLRRVLELVALRDDATVTTLCNVLAKVKTSGEGAVRIEPAAKLLNLMVEGASILAKATDAKDLRKFAAILDSKRHEFLDLFVAQATVALSAPPATAAGTKLSESELSDYLARLKQALGDERAFEAVYLEVSRDGRVKAPESKKLAKAFAGKSGASKAEALGLIYGRHREIMGARPRGSGTGGRLAG
jgi:hypothetical protein